MIFLHGLEPLQILRALHVEEAGATPDHENLADLFFDGEFSQGLLGSLVAVRGIDGSGAWVLFFGECGQGQCQDKKYGRENSQHAGTIAEEWASGFRLWDSLNFECSQVFRSF
jgi:hypothetical protein